ncbi:MAG: nucleotidyltransferase domain-containing protein [Acidobacteria bacterium]|nr:nucleotidyltransferase domain-containing protein [Acidobacteriota bacterium]
MRGATAHATRGGSAGGKRAGSTSGNPANHVHPRAPGRYDATAREWRGINPDGTVDETMLAEVTAAIVAAVQPQKIVLFGSAARGTMNRNSDIDLLVIKDGVRYRRTAARIHMQLPARARQIDIVVASTIDVARHRHKPYYVFEPALREGRVLYDETADT